MDICFDTPIRSAMHTIRQHAGAGTGSVGAGRVVLAIRIHDLDPVARACQHGLVDLAALRRGARQALRERGWQVLPDRGCPPGAAEAVLSVRVAEHRPGDPARGCTVLLGLQAIAAAEADAPSGRRQVFDYALAQVSVGDVRRLEPLQVRDAVDMMVRRWIDATF